MQVFAERGPSRVSPFLVPMMLPDSSAGMVAIQLGVRGPNMAVVTACATGTNAVGEAAEIIRRGQAMSSSQEEVRLLSSRSPWPA